MSRVLGRSETAGRWGGAGVKSRSIGLVHCRLQQRSKSIEVITIHGSGIKVIMAQNIGDNNLCRSI